jgi:DNA-binding response OmpR family regulator
MNLRFAVVRIAGVIVSGVEPGLRLRRVLSEARDCIYDGQVRVLLVEDEPLAAKVLAKGLREQSYAVDIASDGAAALFQVETTEYDALILDLMLPRVDGLTVCRSLRDANNAVPILMLTARDAVEARIAGLDCGADDYLVKPYDFGELVARLRAVIRRGHRPVLPDRLVVGPLVIYTHSRCARIRDQEMVLTAKEFALLEYLCRHAGQVVSRAQIAEHVWDEHYEPFSNVVDVYIQRLRRKLEAAGEPSLIRTRRREGYQLADAPS